MHFELVREMEMVSATMQKLQWKEIFSKLSAIEKKIDSPLTSELNVTILNNLYHIFDMHEECPITLLHSIYLSLTSSPFIDDDTRSTLCCIHSREIAFRRHRDLALTLLADEIQRLPTNPTLHPTFLNLRLELLKKVQEEVKSGDFAEDHPDLVPDSSSES
jgi:hypothetical protein